MDYLIIDRFEGEYAVCEKSDGTMTKIAKVCLPKNAESGDAIIKESDFNYKIDNSLVANIKTQINDLQNKLFR